MSLSDWARFFTEGWPLVIKAPFPFIVVAATAWLITKVWYHRLVMIAERRRDFAEDQVKALENDLARSHSPTLSPSRIYPKLLVRTTQVPRPTFTFSNDGDARALNVHVDALKLRHWVLTLPVIPQIPAKQERSVMANLAPPYDTGDPQYVACFWDGAPSQGELLFTVRYSDVEGRAFLTEYLWRWFPNIAPTLIFQHWKEITK